MLLLVFGVSCLQLQSDAQVQQKTRLLDASRAEIICLPEFVLFSVGPGFTDTQT